MAKMTLSGVQSFAATYVDASLQAGAWNATTNNLLGLIDKIGKIVTIDGEYNDPLQILNGDELPLGKTIEEYFIDLVLPTAYTDPATDGALDLTPNFPTVESVTYSYTLGRNYIKVSEPYNNIERAANTAKDAANMTAKIIERLYNSETLYEYVLKKNLLGNAATKAITASSNLYTEIAKPVDTLTGEAFIKAVKGDIEAARFATDTNNLGQFLNGKPRSLVLFLNKGVMPSIEVDTLAGAFNEKKLAVPCEVIIVDDFGSAASSVYGILADPRGLKLHNTYRAVRSRENATGDFINFVEHTEFTAFISTASYIHVYKTA